MDFLKVCMEIGVDSVLPDSFKIRYNGEIYDVKVEYPWKPLKCMKCKVFGHATANCGGMVINEKRAVGGQQSKRRWMPRIMSEDKSCLGQELKNEGSVELSIASGKIQHQGVEAVACYDEALQDNYLELEVKKVEESGEIMVNEKLEDAAKNMSEAADCYSVSPEVKIKNGFSVLADVNENEELNTKDDLHVFGNVESGGKPLAEVVKQMANTEGNVYNASDSSSPEIRGFKGVVQIDEVAKKKGVVKRVQFKGQGKGGGSSGSAVSLNNV